MEEKQISHTEEPANVVPKFCLREVRHGPLLLNCVFSGMPSFCRSLGRVREKPGKPTFPR